MNLVGLPLAVRSLSAEDVGVLAQLWVIAAWVGFFNPLVGPAAGLAIATSLTGSNTFPEAYSTARGALGAGLVFSLFLSGAAGLVGKMFLELPSVVSVIIAVIVCLLTNYVAIGDGIRTGFHLAHKNGIWAGIGTLVGAVFVVAVFVQNGSVLWFAAGLFLIPLTVRSVAFTSEFAHLVHKRPTLGTHWRQLIKRNAYHMGTIQIGGLCGFPLAMLLLIQIHPDQVGQAFVVQTIGYMVLGLFAGVFEPFGTASADALGRGDVAWLSRVSRSVIVGCTAVSIVFTSAAVTVAPIITGALYGAAGPDQLSLGLIALAVGPAAAFGFYYQLLLGLGKRVGAAKSVIPGYVLGSLASVFGSILGSISLIILGAMLVPTVIGLAQLAPKVRRELDQHRLSEL